MRQKHDTQGQVAANVRAEVAANGMTIKQLGEVLGLGERAASRRWHGEVAYTLDELAKLGEHFGIPWSEFAKPRRLAVAS
ncbi:helix-turn-helix domain-containing protein [Leucobacter tenebrionis]|uniref:helix-turn-helix domain-containing protein n=1 Tax=Leucobacter tenebrionis TaxID=2873270 RepID=UPI001CA773CE|nr:helix-turn-helix transcriptional regulator [Leucobacter tenebrionis]QZY52889.1 helix-turn-helix transcriptional regulator [Leucobacter tenebrionis]